MSPPLGAVRVGPHLGLEQQCRLVKVAGVVGLVPKAARSGYIEGRQVFQGGRGSNLYALLQRVLEPYMRVVYRDLELVLGSRWGLRLVS